MQKVTKRIFLALTCVFVLSAGVAWWYSIDTIYPGKPCAFCDQKVIQTHTFYEDNLVRGMCTHKPVISGHCLVVIKRHIEKIEDASDEEFLAIGRLIKKINRVIQKINGPSAYFLLQKNGKEVGQTVPHVHVHYIPRPVTDNKFAPIGVLLDFFTSPFRQKLSQEEMAEWVGKIRQELERVA